MKTFEVTPQIAEILDGEVSDRFQYYITTGQSNNSKGVLYVMYAVNALGMWIYRGNLGADLLTAAKNARRRCRFKIEVLDEYLADRRQNLTFPFGKYAGQTIEEVFDKDERYIYWLSENCISIKSKQLRQLVESYAEIAKSNIITANKQVSNAALPIDSCLVTRSLSITKIEEYSEYYAGRETKAYKVSLLDESGNKLIYKGSCNKFVGKSKGDSITLNCKVISTFEYLGTNYNKIVLK